MTKEFKIVEKPVAVPSPDNPGSIGEGISALITSNTRMARDLEKEREKSEKWCKELLLDMLEVADSLERILVQTAEFPEQVDVEKMAGFIRSTSQQLAWLLKRRGAVPFDTLGKAADPALTEIVGKEERSDCPENEVIKENEKGYLYKDKLLRRARVVVAKKKEA